MKKSDATNAFLNAAADFADRRKIDLVFVRDDGEWAAIFRFSDARGAFSAELPEFAPAGKTKEAPAESEEQFIARVAHRADRVIVDARKARAQRFGNVQALKAA